MFNGNTWVNGRNLASDDTCIIIYQDQSCWHCVLPSLKLTANAPANGSLEYELRFLLGFGLFSGAFAVSFREGHFPFPSPMASLFNLHPTFFQPTIRYLKMRSKPTFLLKQKTSCCKLLYVFFCANKPQRTFFGAMWILSRNRSQQKPIKFPGILA